MNHLKLGKIVIKKQEFIMIEKIETFFYITHLNKKLILFN